MWIQRRPGGSTRSTRGSSARSGARSAALARERRPNGLRGRLGMGATERLVGRRHNARDSTPVRFFRYLYRRTHQEGWRDWPDEAPPTLPVARREKVAIPTGSKTMAWEMRRRAPARRTPAAQTGRRVPRHMPADALQCKECQTTYPLDARYVCERCFGPLEVAYRPLDADPSELKRRIQAGPHTLWRYADFLPLTGPARSALPTGWTPLVR